VYGNLPDSLEGEAWANRMPGEKERIRIQRRFTRTLARRVIRGPSLLLGRDHIAGGAEPREPNTIYNSCTDGSHGIFYGNFGPESNDRIVVYSNSGGPLTHGTTATSPQLSGPTNHYIPPTLSTSSTRPMLLTQSWFSSRRLCPPRAEARTCRPPSPFPAGASRLFGRNFRYKGSAFPCDLGDFTDDDDLISAVT